MPQSCFADRLIAQVRQLGAPLCVGLDPFAERIPVLFGDGRTPEAVERFCLAVLELAKGRAAAVKPQAGLFEPMGAEGWAVLARVCLAAKDLGLGVILDAKRGDIGTTAQGYARMAFGPAPGLDCDAVTVNPYMGIDSLAPFLDLAEAEGRGVAALVRTSNPGAADLQDLDCGGKPVWARVGEMLAPHCRRLLGESGWSGLMAVAGATAPEQARALRKVMPTALFLIPGYGAQGAGAAQALAGFAPGPAGLEGGLVNASRAVLYPPEAGVARNMAAWKAAIIAAMDTAVLDLGAATRSGGA